MTVDLDQGLRALSLVVLLLYLAPAVPRLRIPARAGRWMRRAALAILGVGLAIAVFATADWFMTSHLATTPAS